MTYERPFPDYPYILLEHDQPELTTRWTAVRVTMQDDGGPVCRLHFTDETGKPVKGLDVTQCWPDPHHADDLVDKWTDASGSVEFAVVNNFDPNKGQSGPHWFYPRCEQGVGRDLIGGFGMILNRHNLWDVWYEKRSATQPPDDEPPDDEPPDNSPSYEELLKRVNQLEVDLTQLEAEFAELVLKLRSV